MTLRTTFVASLFSAASLPLVLAANPVPPTQTNLDEVVVTTLGVGGSSLAGTSAPSTVDAASIRTRQSASLSDALRATPGVHASRGNNLLSANFGLRAFGNNAVMPTDANVQFNLDGASAGAGSNYRNSGSMLIDPALVKRLTIRKGPLASLEFGSGLAGGVINAETINASDMTNGEVGLKFRQMIGANSNGDGWVTSSTAAWQATEDLEFLANYTRRAQKPQKDGFGQVIGEPNASNRFSDTTNSFNVPSYLLKARYRFGQDKAQSLSFSHTYAESAERNVSYGQIHNAGFGTVNRDRKGTVSTLTYGYAPSGNDLVDLEVAISRARHRLAIQTITAPASFGGIYDLATDKLSVKNTAKFQTGSVAHTLRAGLELSKSDRDNASGVTFPGTDKRAALFALDEMDFGNGLKATLGARLERGTLTSRRTGLTGVYKNTARTLGFGLEQDFGAGWVGYASATYGENLPTVDTLAGAHPERKQRNRTYEAGLRYEGADLLGAEDRFSASLGLYHTTVWDAASYTASVNEGFDYKGLEASASYNHASGLYARASATLSDNRSRTASTGWVDYQYSPANSANLTLGKRWDNGLDTSWSVSANDSLTYNGAKSAGWAVHDVALSYTPSSGMLAGATVNLGIDNVFDKGYRTNLSTLNEAGRNFKVSLSKTF